MRKILAVLVVVSLGACCKVANAVVVVPHIAIAPRVVTPHPVAVKPTSMSAPKITTSKVDVSEKPIVRPMPVAIPQNHSAICSDDRKKRGECK